MVVLALVAGGGYWAWKTRSENRAQLLLTDAIVVVQTPVEEAKPGAKPTRRQLSHASSPRGSRAGEVHRGLQRVSVDEGGHCGALLRGGGARDARAARQKPRRDTRRLSTVRAAASFYGRMARLGVVEANAQAKQYDQAISAAQALVNNTADEAIPRDALLMELGRVQAAAGKKAEAKQTLDKVIAEFPESPYIDEAKLRSQLSVA